MVVVDQGTNEAFLGTDLGAAVRDPFEDWLDKAATADSLDQVSQTAEATARADLASAVVDVVSAADASTTDVLHANPVLSELRTRSRLNSSLAELSLMAVAMGTVRRIDGLLDRLEPDTVIAANWNRRGSNGQPRRTGLYVGRVDGPQALSTTAPTIEVKEGEPFATVQSISLSPIEIAFSGVRVQKSSVGQTSFPDILVTSSGDDEPFILPVYDDDAKVTLGQMSNDERTHVGSRDLLHVGADGLEDFARRLEYEQGAFLMWLAAGQLPHEPITPASETIDESIRQQVISSIADVVLQGPLTGYADDEIGFFGLVDSAHSAHFKGLGLGARQYSMARWTARQTVAALKILGVDERGLVDHSVDRLIERSALNTMGGPLEAGVNNEDLIKERVRGLFEKAHHEQSEGVVGSYYPQTLEA